MRLLLAVVAFLLCGCRSSLPTTIPTGPNATEPSRPVFPQAASLPAPTPTSTPPQQGPSYWEAYVTDGGWLKHRNFSGHMQHVVACAYKANLLIEDGPGEWDRLSPVNGREGDAAPWVVLSLFPFPPSSWAWDPPVMVQVFGLVGSARACTPTPAGIGNITTRRTISWPPPRMTTP